MHVDYVAGVGVNALTLIAPLKDYPQAEGFQLLYEQQTEEAEVEAAEDAEKRDAEATKLDPVMQSYQYKAGRAIVFGASFRHSTEPGCAADDEPHAYLCFTFGSDRPEHWPLISQTIDGDQSRVLARPDGALVLSRLGRRLAEEEASARDAVVVG